MKMKIKMTMMAEVVMVVVAKVIKRKVARKETYGTGALKSIRGKR